MYSLRSAVIIYPGDNLFATNKIDVGQAIALQLILSALSYTPKIKVKREKSLKLGLLVPATTNS
jgi:hypothetical protein